MDDYRGRNGANRELYYPKFEHKIEETATSPIMPAADVSAAANIVANMTAADVPVTAADVPVKGEDSIPLSPVANTAMVPIVFKHLLTQTNEVRSKFLWGPGSLHESFSRGLR